MEKLPIVRFQQLLIFLTAISLFFSCGQDTLEPDEDPEKAVLSISDNPNAAAVSFSGAKSQVIEGHYIVIVSGKPARKDPRAAAALEALSKEVGQKSRARVNRSYKSALTGFAAELTDEQVEELRKDPRVQAIEQDGYVYPVSNVAVQEYAAWGLDRIDQQVAMLDRAYTYSATGKGVTAYIIDSGIRFSHSEFGGRATVGRDFVLEENPDNTNPEQGPGEDCNGHGTHVAGTVGGATYGVAKEVSLVSVRVFGCSGGAPRSRVIEAVDWITQDVQENGRLPAVVNMSLGGGYDPESLSYEVAIGNSTEAGISYVVAAGNADGDACNFEPARNSNALTVGASEIGDRRAWFSNYGDCVDVYAPGVKITSASHLDDGSFRDFNGTSMAAPHVAGLAALYLEGNAEATPSQVHSAIVANSTKDAVYDVPSGTNNLIYSHWEPVDFTPPPAPDLMLEVAGYKEKSRNIIQLKWKPTNDQYVQIYRNGVYFSNWYNDGVYTLETKGKGDDAYQVCETNYLNCSDEVFPNFDGDGEYVPNIAPTSSFTYVVDGLEVQFTDTSTDEDGSVISWSWWFGDGYGTTQQHPKYTYREAGTYKVELIVHDDLREQGASSQTILVSTENPSPEEINLSAHAYKASGKWRTDLSWTPAGTSEKIDIYRDGQLIATTANTGSYNDITNFRGSGLLTYKVCEAGSSANCSNDIMVQF